MPGSSHDGSAVVVALEFHQHIVAILLQGIRCGLRIARVGGDASDQIELPLVPGADDFSMLHGPFGEWPAAVRADVVERMRLAAQGRHTKRFAQNAEFLRLAL